MATDRQPQPARSPAGRSRPGARSLHSLAALSERARHELGRHRAGGRRGRRAAA